MDSQLKIQILRDFHQALHAQMVSKNTTGHLAMARIYLSATKSMMNKYNLTIDEFQVIIEEKCYNIRENL